MDLAHALGRYVPAAWIQTTAEIDAEIREELEFHLDMRTEENIRAGMAPDEARRDAQQRFGDFDTSRRACRTITLGPRLMLRWLQAAVLSVLIGVIVYQAVLLVKVQAANQSKIESLTNTINELQAAQQAPATESVSAQPIIQVSEDWHAGSDSLKRPWCDWGLLDVAGEGPTGGDSASP